MPRIPSDIRSIEELRESALNGRIAPGSTVEVALAHPELQTREQIEPLKAVLRAAALKLCRNANLVGSDIYVYPPGEHPA